MQHAKPEPFTPDQLKGAKELRQRLTHILPPVYNTDFCMARWYRAYNGNFDVIEGKISEVIAHRRTLSYGDIDDVNIYDFSRATFERFSISRLHVDVYSDDVAVFLQRMKNVDIKEIMKVIPLGHVLNSYFLLQECFNRAIHAHEERTGRPSAVVVVIDLAGLVISDYVNPLSTPSKLARYVVQIWSDYFSENLIRLYLINPPAIVSLMWQISKHILDAKTQSRIVFVTKVEDLQNFLTKEAIPEEFGGLRRDTTGFSETPESCVSAPKIVSSNEYFTEEKFWKSRNVTAIPDPITATLKQKTVHTFDIHCETGQTLVWLFSTNCEITFEIVYLVDQNTTTEVVWPKIKLVVLKTPENGTLKCTRMGAYQARFNATTTSWLSSPKITYRICAI